MQSDEKGNIVPFNEKMVEVLKTIRERRKLLKINQEDLAELAGISQRYLYTIETATANPSLVTLLKILDVLGLEIEIKLKSTK